MNYSQAQVWSQKEPFHNLLLLQAITSEIEKERAKLYLLQFIFIPSIMQQVDLNQFSSF